MSKVILIPDPMKEIAVCPDYGLLQLENIGEYFIYICMGSWHGKALQWGQHHKLCRVVCFGLPKFGNAFSKFFGMLHTPGLCPLVPLTARNRPVLRSYSSGQGRNALLPRTEHESCQGYRLSPARLFLR